MGSWEVARKGFSGHRKSGTNKGQKKEYVDVLWGRISIHMGKEV